MRIVRRTARRQATDDATALVAVASQALPAALPMEQMCAEQYQRIVPIAYAVAERTLGYDAARDVVQDVFFHFWRRWNELTPEHRSDAAIMSAVKNKVVDVLRRDERWAALLDELQATAEVPVVGPFEPDSEVSLADVIRRIIAQLPPRCRQSYLLVHEDGFTYNQAAAALGVGYETVKGYLKRSNFLIREALVGGGYRVDAGESVKSLPSSSEASHD